MQAKFSKRLCAYLIDVIIISVVFQGIMMFFPESKNITVLESELTVLNEQYLKEEMDLSIYWNRYADLIKSIDKENVPYVIINILLILGYFVLLPFYWDGQTIGKKIFNLKISKRKEKIGLNDLILRTFIVNGIGASLISLCFIYIVPETTYLTITVICGFIQILLVIISSFMIIYRHDKRGVQDFISSTQVLEG